MGLGLDVSCGQSVKTVFIKIKEHFSRPPCIIANVAGITRDNLLANMDEESFQKVLDVNLKVSNNNIK